MNTNATTNFIRFSEPTMRSNASQAYSQCLPEPEPNYGYSPEPNYGYDSYYGEQAPLPQQPVQAPIGQPSSSSRARDCCSSRAWPSSVPPRSVAST